MSAMYEPTRPVEQLRQELRELAITIGHYERQERHSEANQARQDYAGLLQEACRALGLDPLKVHHPLLGGPSSAPAGVTSIS